MSSPARSRVAWRCAGLLLTLLLISGSAQAHHFGSRQTGGKKPTQSEPERPECNSCPCEPSSSGCGSGEPVNSTSAAPNATGGEPVDLFTGRLFFAKTDLVVKGVVPIRMLRYYDSQSRYDSPLGYGWSFSYDMRLFEYGEPAEEVVVRGWEGRRWEYLAPEEPATQYIDADPTEGRQPILERDTASGDAVEHVLTLDSGERALFDNEGRIHALETPQGNRLRFFYSAQKMPLTGRSHFAVSPTTLVTVAHVWQLLEIKEQLRSQVGTSPEEFTGRSIELEYDNLAPDPTGRLVAITSHDGRAVEYFHDETDPYPDTNPASNPAGFRGNLARVVGAHTLSEEGIEETYRYPLEVTAPLPTPAGYEHIHNLTYRQDGANTQPLTTEYDFATDRVSRQCFMTGPGTCTTTASTFGSWEFNYPTAVRRTVVRTIATPPPTPTTTTAMTEFEFNPQGFLTVKKDALNNRIEYVRPNGHELSEVRVYEAGSPTASRTITYGHAADGRLSSKVVAVSGSDTVTESWDFEGRFTSLHEVSSTEDQAEDPTKIFKTDLDFFYDAHGRPENVQAIKRRKGSSGGSEVFVATTMTYDPAHGQLATVTPPATTDNLTIRRFYYTSADDLPAATPPRIRNGLLKRIDLADGASAIPQLAREFDYDAAGNVELVTDAKGNVSEFAWDGRGRLVRETHHVGTSETWESTLLRYGAPNVNVADPADDTDLPGEYLLQIETGALGAAGTGVEGQVHRMVHDSRGNVIRVERKPQSGSFVALSSHTYDSDGNRIRSSQPTATGTREFDFTYNALQRLVKVVDEALNETSFQYDTVGNRTKLTAENGVTDFVYDDLDRLVSIVQPGALTTAFDYDAVGNVTRVTDPKSQVTDYAYDTLSRLRRVTQALGVGTPSDPDDYAVRYDYDDRGQLTTVTNARDQILHSSYFVWGGLEAVVHDLDGDGIESGEREVSYTYDFNGNLATASDTLFALDLPPAGQLYTFVHDERNRVKDATAHLVDGEPLLRSSYDPFGNRAELALDPAGENLRHQWTVDKRGRLVAACLPQDQETPTVPCAPGGGTETLAFAPLANDDIETITHGNGLETDLLYHPEGPIDLISVGSGPLMALDYTIDTMLFVDTIEETQNGTLQTPDFDYDYDALGRLTGAQYPTGLVTPTSESFGYDAASNRDDNASNPSPWAYDANNRISASPTTGGGADTSYAFDDDGNLTTRTTPAGTETFTWDAQNRLTRYQNTASSADVHYAYDPFGRRIRKSGTSGTTLFLWDGDQLLAEYDSSGDRTVRYAYAGGFAPVQVAYPDGLGGEDIYDVHSDHLDTPRMLTDEFGVPSWRANYAAFGEAHLSADPDGIPVTLPPDFDFNIRFPGQYYDAESGLHYNRFRTYDPGTGRYISADPIGQFQLVEWMLARATGMTFAGRPLTPGTTSSNLFTYANNTPGYFIDPDGLIYFATSTTVAGGAGPGPGGSGPAKASRSGSYVDLGRGDFGSFDAADSAITSSPNAAYTRDFTLGAGPDPTGSSKFFSGSFGAFGLVGGCSVASSSSGPSVTFSFGLGTPRANATLGITNATGSHQGNFYKNLQNALTAPFRIPHPF